LGGGRILTLATAVVGVWLFIGQQKMLAIAWGMSQALSGLLMGTLKSAFARTRPEFADPLIGSGWSFPSGHAMGTFVFCAVGCYLLLRGRRSWPLAVAVVTAASGWCVIMAFSRLYLGVHYVSDVIAGMLAGMAWSAVSISAMEILRTRYGRSSRRA
jgi:undecaprenyl-diphosphatase